MPSYRLSDFDYCLPPGLIAQYPSLQRSGSRLLDGTEATPQDRVFGDLPCLLRPCDLLVFNDTRVIKARLFGHKPSGGRLELLVERVLSDHQVIAQMRTSHKPAIGTVITLDSAPGCHDHPRATLLGRWPDDCGPLFRLALANDAGDGPLTLLDLHGHVPLPPYVKHSDTAMDADRYQTVIAKNPGAVAAPTAALHFDHPLLATLDAQGVRRACLTLHVGSGTFTPVKTEDLACHRMHSERYDLPDATRGAVEDCHAQGGRVIAVGSTSLRTLETFALNGQTSGDTDLFITPGFEFKIVDALITNFHLPKSSLMMLVSAFAGHTRVMALYAHAVQQKYRFFSYGDAMFLSRALPASEFRANVHDHIPSAQQTP